MVSVLICNSCYITVDLDLIVCLYCKLDNIMECLTSYLLWQNKNDDNMNWYDNFILYNKMLRHWQKHALKLNATSWKIQYNILWIRIDIQPSGENLNKNISRRMETSKKGRGERKIVIDLTGNHKISKNELLSHSTFNNEESFWFI